MSVQKREKFWVVTLKGLRDRDAAALWTHARVEVLREELPEPDEDEFYYNDILACSVVDHQGNPIGTVKECFDNGAHDVLVIKCNDGEERMVAVVGEFVSEIDLEEERITLTEDTELV